MRDPNPAKDAFGPAAPPSPDGEPMRRPRQPADDDDTCTVKRSYLPADDQERDAAQPLLPASIPPAPPFLLESPVDALEAQVSWPQALNDLLLCAVETRQPLAVTMLLDRGANVNLVDPLTGDTPLLVAMDNNYWSMMELLLVRGAEPDFVDPVSGNTPLMVAICERKWTAVALLLAHGAHEDFINPTSGLTARMIAYQQGDGTVLSPMLACREFQGADFTAGAAFASPPALQPAEDIMLLPGAWESCDTDRAYVTPAPAPMRPGAQIIDAYLAANDVSAANDPTGFLSPMLLAVLSGPWHTE